MKPEKPLKLFGTDGIRGEAGKFPLDSLTIRRIGSSLANRLAERLGRPPLLVFGRDTRESGPWIEQDLIAGAQNAGAEIQSAGVITTPGVAFLTREISAAAGIVISASHNPYQDNGIKVFDPSGRKLDDATERQIEQDIADNNSSDSFDGLKPQRIQEPAGFLHDRYLNYLEHDVASDVSLEGLTLVVDCANGAAYEIAPHLFQRLGARVIAINNEPDGRNINLNCGSLHIEDLQHRVVAERADLGVAFDGDADRALFVDQRGKFVDGDATLWVLANYLQSQGDLAHELVVATVMTNLGLEIALRDRGIKLTRTDVGDKYVLDELLRSKAILGGEQSGHIIFPQISLAGDGLITAIKLLQVMQSENTPLDELTQGFTRFPQVLLNVHVKEKTPFTEISAVQKAVRDIESGLGNRGRLLLRYSGTESLARVMVEGEHDHQVNAYASQLASVIEREIGANWKPLAPAG